MNDIEITYDPIRRNFIRAEIVQAMNEWMIKNMGNPMTLGHDERNHWYRDNGMMHAFLCDVFPVDLLPKSRILDKIKSGPSLASMIEASRTSVSD